MSDNLGPIACAGSTPTVNNVNHVTATETGDKELVDFAIEAPGVFQPGATDAGDTGVFNPNEIEWTVDLGNGYDVLSYYGAGDPDGARITYGTLGVNHNVSDNTLANDLDVEITGVNAFRFDGGNDDDGVSGAGTQGTGNPTSSRSRPRLPHWRHLRSGRGTTISSGGAATTLIKALATPTTSQVERARTWPAGPGRPTRWRWTSTAIRATTGA